MIKFQKPTNLNGAELIAELNAAGVAITEPPFVDDSDLWLHIADKDKAKATPIVAAHNGSQVAPEPTFADKLATAGITVDELKVALGL